MTRPAVERVRNEPADRPIVAVTDTAVPDDTLERRLAEAEGAEYRAWNGTGDLGDLLDGASVVFTNFVPLGPAELGRMPAGAALIRYGIGVDNVDLAAAAAAGVRLCNVPDYGANVVADQAAMTAVMLVLFAGIVAASGSDAPLAVVGENFETVALVLGVVAYVALVLGLSIALFAVVLLLGAATGEAAAAVDGVRLYRWRGRARNGCHPQSGRA